MSDKSHRKSSAAERLAKLQEQIKSVEAELKREELARLTALGTAVAALLSADPETRAFLMPKLRASVTSAKAKADLAPLFLEYVDAHAPPSPAPAVPEQSKDSDKITINE